MDQLIKRLELDFPQLSFVADKNFHWSPEHQQISYNPAAAQPKAGWALLHEVGHAMLGHSTYRYDFELLNLEVAAWQKAQSIARNYKQKISDDHVQNCLDSYREWLHRRSTCPTCSSRSLQQNSGEYSCFNCHSIWKVSASRFGRSYRQSKSLSNNPPPVRAQTFFM